MYVDVQNHRRTNFINANAILRYEGEKQYVIIVKDIINIDSNNFHLITFLRIIKFAS